MWRVDAAESGDGLASFGTVGVSGRRDVELLLPEALAQWCGSMLVGEAVGTGEVTDLRDQLPYGDIEDLGNMLTGGSESGMNPAIAAVDVGGDIVLVGGEGGSIY
jgi:hypothetical protein